MESVGIDIAKDAVVIATTIVVHAITKTTTITAVVNMLVNSTKTGILEGCMSDDWQIASLNKLLAVVVVAIMISFVITAI